MKKNDIILLLATTAVLVLAWIGFSIYHNSIKSTVGETLTIQIAPIAPNFDTKVIERLQMRKSIIPVFEVQQVASIAAPASPSASPIASPTATLQQASQAATLQTELQTEQTLP